ncbi:hypothetical protein Syun_004790 [Stephania yunnanensis]|uniref:ENTH domain-containing protein n=1 Tax=Stephania yunnanensis TaxID=152371 RepID=A0AAP0L3Q6_9MAGN
MGQQRLRRYIVGTIKDKASLSKAALFNTSSSPSSLQVAVIRATTHHPSSPPHQNHISAVLSYGFASRATASLCIHALMDRLHTTRDASVALKCLITVHNIIKRGSFILQDQLSVCPNYGGKNYLNLSNFKDNSTPHSWALSFWVRWYARVLESIVYASRVLGVFFASAAAAAAASVERISGVLNGDLLRELDALVGVMEEISWAPDSSSLWEKKLATEAVWLAGGDYCSAQNEIGARLQELGERFVQLSVADTVELSCALKRIEDCKERLVSMFANKKGSSEAAGGSSMWGLAGEMKRKIDKRELCGDGRLVVRLGMCRGVQGTESARFGDERVKRIGGESRLLLLGSTSLRVESVIN